MGRKSYKIKAGGKDVKLRLTTGGQRSLKEKTGEDALSVILGAATDMEFMIALLTEALNWTDSGNEITDGAELYDLLVDEGYAGQGKFAELAVQIGVASGLLNERNGKRAQDAVSRSIDKLFDRLDGKLDQWEASDTENPPTAAAPG